MLRLRRHGWPTQVRRWRAGGSMRGHLALIRKHLLADSECDTLALLMRPQHGAKARLKCAIMSSTTLADLFTPHLRADPPLTVWAALRRRSSDDLDDGVTHGGQAWLRRRSVNSFFPASLF